MNLSEAFQMNVNNSGCVNKHLVSDTIHCLISYLHYNIYANMGTNQNKQGDFIQWCLNLPTKYWDKQLKFVTEKHLLI